MRRHKYWEEYVLKYYIDRIEEGIAIADNDAGERITVPVAELPIGVRDGSVLEKLPDGTFVADEKTEAERRSSLNARLQRLKKRNKQ